MTRCATCGQPHRLPHIDTMEPRNALDWSVIFIGALMVLIIPLALVVFAGAVTS